MLVEVVSYCNRRFGVREDHRGGMSRYMTSTCGDKVSSASEFDIDIAIVSVMSPVTCVAAMFEHFADHVCFCIWSVSQSCNLANLYIF